ncbi:MAG: BON domain-containing protein [Ignavibacteriales bacterium]|nr:BON domain-containing protein [Ignavibacteriales bacterium]
MQYEDEKSLELLKQIFLAENNERLEEFEKELDEIKLLLNDKEKLINLNLPITAELLRRKIDKSNDEMAEVFYPIFGKALKKQIAESKDEIIDILYPIMGQTIKKTVTEAIKDLYESINLKIDNALRKGIFSKKIKSTISGVSTSDLIIQESFPFLINEIFLIHEKSGLLISHVSSSQNDSTDADIISSMLSAIKNFVSESFKSDSESKDLYEIQYGDSKIILERGLYSYLAVVVKGQEPIDFDEELSDLKNDIHEKYSKKLREFDGENTFLKNIEIPLKEFLHKYKIKIPIVEEIKPKPVLAYLLFSILAIILIVIGIIKIPQYFTEKSIDQQIKSKISVIDGVDLENISWQNNNGKVILSGMVNNFDLRSRVDSAVNSIKDIESFKNNLGVLFIRENPESIITEIKKDLAGIDTENISYQVKEDYVIVEGLAESEDTKMKISNIIAKVPGVRIVINNLNVKNAKWDLVEFEKLLNNKILYFEIGKSELTNEHIDELKLILMYLKNNSSLKINIKGFSDGAKTISNLDNAKSRAQSTSDYLTSQGVNSEQINIGFDVSNDKNLLNNRRVEFEIASKD